MSSAGYGNGAESNVGTLCLTCVRETGVDGGGVSMFSGKGTPVFMHATDATARVIEDLQFRLGEGPCIDAASTGQPVMVPDLATHEAELAERWPAFLAEVADTDARALFAFPIRVAGIGLGIVDLYRRTPGGLGPDQVSAGLSGAEALGTSLLTPDNDQGDNVSYPLTVHRAAGMVMVQLDSSIEEALVRLRATAYLEGMLVTALALDVLEGRRRFAKEES
jgi:hypothetical protein